MTSGLLTFHSGPNHGGFLQMFCLLQEVRKHLPETVLIDYKNRQHRWMEDIRPFFHYRRPSRFIDHIAKARAFRKALAAIPSTPGTTDPKVLQAMEFGTVVFGSDVIWDFRIFGEYDSTFFGDLPARRRIAYAASFGSVRPDEPVPDAVAKRINSFDALSVRDINSAQIVEKITGMKVQQVVDPVFLPDSLEPLVSNEPDATSPYILVYGGKYDPADARIIQQFARSKNLPIVSMGRRNLWADIQRPNEGPFEGLAWFKNASYVFSSTFHGAIFAIRFQKNFVVKLHPEIKNKVTSLLLDLEIPERGGKLDEIYPKLESEIDFAAVNARLAPLVKESKKYLTNALAAK